MSERHITSFKHSDEYEPYYAFVDNSESMEHYGVKDQKWGKRNWQYKDGSLTPEGRIHYGVGSPREQRTELAKRMVDTAKRQKEEIRKEQSAPKKDTALEKIRKTIEKGANAIDKNVTEATKNLSAEKIRDAISKEAKSVDKDVTEAVNNIGKEFGIKKLSGEGNFDGKAKPNPYAKKKPDQNELGKKSNEIADRSLNPHEKKETFEGARETDEELKKTLGIGLDDIVTDGDGMYTRRKDGQPFKMIINGKLIKRDNLEDMEDEIRGAKKEGWSIKIPDSNSESSEKTVSNSANNKSSNQNKTSYRQDIVRDDEYYKQLNEYHEKVFNDGTVAREAGKIMEKLKRENGNIFKNIANPIVVDTDGEVYRIGSDTFDRTFKHNGKTIDQFNIYDEITENINRKFDSQYKPASKDTTAIADRAASLKKQGLTVEQIAKKLGVPVGTASSYIYG